MALFGKGSLSTGHLIKKFKIRKLADGTLLRNRCYDCFEERDRLEQEEMSGGEQEEMSGGDELDSQVTKE